MNYLLLKQVHLATVTFTLGFFAVRLAWMIRRPELEYRPWVRPLSVFNDTLLLTAGLSMALMSGQYPFARPWLTAKLIALAAYIVLGTFALRRGKTIRIRLFCGMAALACGVYIVAVALTRHPFPPALLWGSG
jgi:uncharacterized membrane protein SirB2